ncbi:MAG TPA: hypothetical protein VIV63_08145 [Steroidobacteraceae bacterium]
MFRRLLSLLVVASPLAMAAGEPEAVEPLPDCIDAVVLARFLDYRPGPIGPLEDDQIVMSWTWDVDVRVREVYFGDIDTGRLTIAAVLHTRFDDELRQPVLFLTRKSDTWNLAYIEFAARDASGNRVLPIFEAPNERYEFSPQGWKPHDYAKWLAPVRYKGSDVAAFEDVAEEETPAEDEWLRVAGGRKIAKRGFRVEDIPAMLAERRAVECARANP